MRALLTCRPLTGHFRPLLPLAHALAAAGHEVAFASGEPVLSEARAEGFTAFRAGLDSSSRDELFRRYPDLHSVPRSEMRAFFFAELFVRIELEPRAADLTAIVERWAPDVAVHEMAEFALPLVATVADIPYASHGFGALIPDDPVRAAGAAAAPSWSSRGLTPHPLGGAYQHLYVDICPPSLDGGDANRPGVIQQIRPVDIADARTPPAWLGELEDRPIVYVTLGTIWNKRNDVFQTILDGLQREELHVIVTVGKLNDPAALGPQPANVHIHRYIPQAALLPRCAAVVTHGGSGTMLGALAHGLPLLFVPQGADQFDNAERTTVAGAGLQLIGSDLTSDSARDRIRRLLTETRFRDTASRIKAEIGAMPHPSEAVGALEQLAL